MLKNQDRVVIPKKKKYRFISKGTPYFFLTPAGLVMCFIVFLPAMIGIAVSFTNFSAKNMANLGTVGFVGIDNYRYLFSSGSGLSQNFKMSLQASLKFVVVNLCGVYIIGMMAALALNKNYTIFRFFRAFFLIPWILPSVVSTFIWKSFLMRDSGGLNDLLIKIGIISQPVYWTAGNMSIISVMMISIWRHWPFVFISLLAGLQSIPGDLYDAAKVDGTTKIQEFRHITLPILFPVSRILILLETIWSALDFNTTYVLYNMVPPKEANVLPLLAYNTSFTQWDFARGATVAVCIMLVMLVLSLFYIRFVVERDMN
jgi:multiple sugar transport system permease protein